MTMISRRAALAGIASAPVAAIGASASPADDEWSLLRSFLENASPAELMHYHLMRAADAVNEFRPGAWRIEFGIDVGFIVLVNGNRPPSRMREKMEATS